MGEPKDINQIDISTWTPLHKAAFKDNLAEVTTLLENGADVNKQDKFDRTALTLACILNHLEIVKKLLENEADPNLGLSLHHACWRGNAEVVQKLLEKNPDVNVKDILGRPPVILAVMESHPLKSNESIVQVLDLLVQNGADINDFDATKSTALHLAAASGNLEVMGAIVRLGGDVTKESKFHHTPLEDNILSLQTDEEQIKFLLDSGASFSLNAQCIATELCPNPDILVTVLKYLDDVNQRNVDNETCLQHVVKYNWMERFLTSVNAEDIKSLIESMDVDNAAVGGSTALHEAVEYDNLGAVNWLLEHGANVNVVTYNNTLPLHIALSKNNVEITKALLDKGSYINVNILDVTFIDVYCDKEFVRDKAMQPDKLSDELKSLILGVTEVHDNVELLGWSTLHHAVYSKDPDKVASVLDDGVDVNAEDNYKRTALSIAAMLNNLELVKILLDNGADVDLGTPLLYAARRGNKEVAAELIEHGANVLLTDRFKRTALHLAIFFDFQEVVELLLQNGADVNNLRDDSQDLPLHVACNSGNAAIVKLLIDNNADVNSQCMHEEVPLTLTKNVEIMRMLLDAGADIHAVNDDKESSLHRATDEEELECVKELIARGCNLNLQNFNGQTALHLCANQPEILEELLQNGADPNVASMEGFTPLHLACLEGNLESVKLLLKHNAYVNFTSLDNILPIYIATVKDHSEIVKELIAANSVVNIEVADLSMIITEYKGRRYNLAPGKTALDCASVEIKPLLE